MEFVAGCHLLTDTRNLTPETYLRPETKIVKQKIWIRKLGEPLEPNFGTKRKDY